MVRKTMIPAGAKRVALRPLALGEASGHHHSLAVLDPADNLEGKVEMFETTDENGKRVYLRVTEDGVALVHQEHKPHAVAIGEYEVIIQTEVTDWGRAAVID